ncbi:hypothetical protein FEM48_Zijuj03G0028100 [Ziziphus jujuba var. spinosa]|uniref:DRBM domain-containing protein n=1 Tax=Ziziphus jujuba var. spinosa TaxID=714518 RepID=A0A978VMQ6_ZIZJJ|nr:hypothetical protein FEM48_Zijuj03G0028100 [Ziziphus jujuba var. spinosa]
MHKFYLACEVLLQGNNVNCLLCVVQLAGTAKSRFSAKDYSDYMALVRAYEGWKDAEREGSAYECWLGNEDASINNRLSHNQSLVRAIICSGLFPGIASVVHRETSMSFKTMDDGRFYYMQGCGAPLNPFSSTILLQNSVNARYQTIPYPWLVFGEKVKDNTVFMCDSTGVSDSILILFGVALNQGVQPGHLKMLEGFVNFFMDPSLSECYLKLKEELNKLIQKKPGHSQGREISYACGSRAGISGDQCEGRFVFGRDSKKPNESGNDDRFTRDGTNPKSLLQTLIMRAGHSPPKYKPKHLKTNEYSALVEFKGLQFVGKPKKNKQLAGRDAAVEALAWLTHTSDNSRDEDDKPPPDLTDNIRKLLGKCRRSKRWSG